MYFLRSLGSFLRAFLILFARGSACWKLLHVSHHLDWIVAVGGLFVCFSILLHLRWMHRYVVFAYVICGCVIVCLHLNPYACRISCGCCGVCMGFCSLRMIRFGCCLCPCVLVILCDVGILTACFCLAMREFMMICIVLACCLSCACICFQLYVSRMLRTSGCVCFILGWCLRILYMCVFRFSWLV